ncbi:unnamed protein product [Caenorhabditis brenneri]
MSESFKYAKNGICCVENFAEHLAAGTFPEIELGRLCGMKWYSAVKISEEGSKIYPVIWCDNSDPEVEHRVQIHFKLLNNSSEERGDFEITGKDVLKFDFIFIGFYTPFLEILDFKNGWLDDGTLSFEYGIQVEAILEDSIWTFNFNDRLFNAGAEQVQFDRVDDPNTVGPLFAHKLLFSFHCTKLEAFLKLRGTDEQFRRTFKNLLQICHGVRLEFYQKVNLAIMNDNIHLKMYTVTSYFDWSFTRMLTWDKLEGPKKNSIFFGSKYNLRHFLASIIKSMTSLKEHTDKQKPGDTDVQTSRYPQRTYQKSMESAARNLRISLIIFRELLLCDTI